MEFEVLGPLLVRADGHEVRIAQAQRRLLALLLMRPNRWIPADVLADGLWREAGGAARLQVLVHRLRRSLGDIGRVQHDQGSYRLRVGPGELDVERFRLHGREGADALAAGEWDAAVRHLRAASALWRGRPYAGLDDLAPVASDASTLDDERLVMLENLYDAEIRAGSAARVLADLSELAAEHPLRERLAALLVLALYRSGRRADALTTYQDVRNLLIEELGLEPGPELRAAQAVVLGDGNAPAASRDPALRQLPPAPTGVLGRADELAELIQLVEGHAGESSPLLVVISGSAGIGKTAFAICAAHLLRDRYQDGQIYLDLRGYASGEPVEAPASTRILLHELGVPPAAVPSGLDERTAMLRSRLAGRRLVLLLDNVRAAGQVRPLLPAANCLLLVTSRNQLRVLAIQDGAHRITLRPLAPADARDVLATAVGKGRAEAEPAAVASLAELCGHVPLALRVAGERAARFPRDTLANLADELSDEERRLDHLGGLDDQASGLRASFWWSYRELPDEDARVFRLLGLHPTGTIGLRAAAALTDSTVSQVHRSLDRLAADHLVVEARPGRFEMHELLRLFAAEMLAEHDAAEAIDEAVVRLVDWYVVSVAAAGTTVRPRGAADQVIEPSAHVGIQAFRGPAEALDWLETERFVILELVRRAAGQGLHRQTWQLAWATTPFYAIRLYLEDWRDVAGAGQSAAYLTGDERAVMWTSLSLGSMHLERREYEDCRAAYRLALEIAERTGHIDNQAVVHSNLGLAAARQGDHLQALAHYQRSLAAEEAAGPGHAQFTAALNLSASYGALGDFRTAIRYGKRAAEYNRRHGSLSYEAIALSNVAEGYLSLGDLVQAQVYCEQALELLRTLNAKQGMANALMVFGHIRRALNDSGSAVQAWEAAHALLLELADPRAAQAEALLAGLGAAST